MDGWKRELDLGALWRFLYTRRVLEVNFFSSSLSVWDGIDGEN